MANAGLEGMMAFAQDKGATIDTILASLEVSRKQIYFGVTADPLIQPPGATFSDVLSVTLTCATADAEMYYTLDGTRPTKDALKYITGTYTYACTRTSALNAYTYIYMYMSFLARSCSTF
jgi:DNA-directed RNA polymerase subunit H (RpoH/RPB5)